MTGDTTELTRELTELAEQPAPPMRLDIERACKTGRRRRRMKAYSVGAGCAAVVLAASLGVPPLLGSPDGTGRDLDKVATPPTDQGVSTEHNPLVAYATFGWLPNAIAGVTYQVGSYGDLALAKGRGELPAMMWLTVHDKEPEMTEGMRQEFGGQQTHRIPVRVGGNEGYWLTTNPDDPLNGGSAYLRWKLPDGTWLQLYSYYLDFADPKDVLLRVAADVTVGERLVPLPLHISSLPGNYTMADTMLSRPSTSGRSDWDLTMRYTVNGANVNIDVRPAGTLPDEEKGGFGKKPTCKTEKGLEACVLVDRPKAAGLDKLGGPEGLLDRITLLGPDESDWTTRVIG